MNDYREGDLIKLSILVNEEMVDALSMIIHKDFAVRQGRLMCERLKDLIPRHQFQIPIQAAIGGKVIARETISGYRKDVISRIHGGGARDRKKKLLEKQKKGKARMRQFGSVDIPQEAFILHSLDRYPRRDGRVVEGARLESVYTVKGIKGSNPFLSAKNNFN